MLWFLKNKGKDKRNPSPVRHFSITSERSAGENHSLVGPTLTPGKGMTSGVFCSISKHPKEKNVTGRSWYVFVGEQCWLSIPSETLGASFQCLRALGNMKILVESSNQKQEEKSFTSEHHENQQR